MTRLEATAKAKATTESPETKVIETAERSRASAAIGNTTGGPVSSYPLEEPEDTKPSAPDPVTSNSLTPQEYPLCDYYLKMGDVND